MRKPFEDRSLPTRRNIRKALDILDFHGGSSDSIYVWLGDGGDAISYDACGRTSVDGAS